MIEKRRCPNCGAYLTDTDAECYVCGEIIGVPNVQPRETKPNQKTYAPVYFEPEANEDFVTPVDFDEVQGTPLEKRRPYTDDDIVTGNEDAGDYSDNYDDSYNNEYSEKYKDFTDFDPYEDYDEDKKPKSSKKTLIICAVLAAIAGIAALVVAIFFQNGAFGGQPDEYTIYFNKPNKSLILRDAKGKGYSWDADVMACYSVDNREDNVTCAIVEEYDNMWECKLPTNASEVYFYQKTGDEIRTDKIVEIEDGHVYYVTDITLNSDNALPIAHCQIDEFDNFGINSIQPTTEPETEKKTKATEKATKKPTETTKPTEATTAAPKGKGYKVTFPANWKKGAKSVKKDNCATYYEKYNYSEYGLGMLMSIYVFEKGDNSYGDLNAKKVLSVSDGRKVVVVTPTDVQFDDSDEVAAEKYLALEENIDEVISSIVTD